MGHVDVYLVGPSKNNFIFVGIYENMSNSSEKPLLLVGHVQ